MGRKKWTPTDLRDIRRKQKKTHGDVYKRNCKVYVDGKVVRRTVYLTMGRKCFVLYNGERRYVQNQKNKWYPVVMRFASVRGV